MNEIIKAKIASLKNNKTIVEYVDIFKKLKQSKEIFKEDENFKKLIDSKKIEE